MRKLLAALFIVGASTALAGQAERTMAGWQNTPPGERGKIVADAVKALMPNATNSTRIALAVQLSDCLNGFAKPSPDLTAAEKRKANEDAALAEVAVACLAEITARK